MGNQNGASKMDAVVKLVLVFFVSLLSFSVGTFVGKQVSDSDHRRASLEQDYKGGREVASESEDKESDEKALSDEDIKSLTDEFVQAEKGKTKTEEPNGETSNREMASEKTNTDPKAEAKAEKDGYKKVAHKSNEKAHETPSPNAAAEKVAEGQSPTKAEPQERKPNSMLPTVASAAVGKYTVQVASYADEDEAKGQASELKEKGWNAFYIPVEIKGRTWYRVNVGLFANSKSAMSFREKFAKEANASSSIIQKIVQ